MNYVYFISDGTNVKIGTSTNLKSRIQQVQTGNSKTLKLIGWIVGDKQIETNLHSRFARYRQTGEWFLLSGEIECLVNDIAAPNLLLKSAEAPEIPVPEQPKPFDINNNDTLRERVELIWRSLQKWQRRRFTDGEKYSTSVYYDRLESGINSNKDALDVITQLIIEGATSKGIVSSIHNSDCFGEGSLESFSKYWEPIISSISVKLTELAEEYRKQMIL